MTDLLRRALIEEVQRRLPNEFERQVAEGLSSAEAATRLLDFMRFEPVVIPAGTPADACHWCGARIYKVRSNHPKAVVNGERLVVSVSVAGEECRRPTLTEDGEGFAHQVDCPGSGLTMISKGR